MDAGLADAWVDQHGRNWRVLKGDFSHIEEHDRPPRVICENLAVAHRTHYDRSETRKPIPCESGKHISELKGKHSGAVAILMNGESMGRHDLSKIKVPIIGLNRAHVGFEGYKGPDPDYLCVVDTIWLTKEAVKNHRGLINASNDPRPIGWRVPKSFRMAPFSFDVGRDGALPTTTGLLSLQVAAYMGFRDIYCLGLDLGGPHFDGTVSGGNMEAQERYCLRAVPFLKDHGVRIWLCGSPESKCKAFPHVPFEALLAA